MWKTLLTEKKDGIGKLHINLWFATYQTLPVEKLKLKSS